MSLEDLFNKGPTDDCGQCEALGAMQKKYLPSIPDLQQTKLNPDNPSSIHHTFWEPANPPDIKQIGRAGNVPFNLISEFTTNSSLSLA